MRILHLYAGNLYGGIERLLSTYAAERDRCPEMQPHFGLCFEGKLSDEIRSSGAPLTMLGNVRLSRPWTTWRARRNLAALLNRSPSFDAVITHASWPHAVFAPVVKHKKVPLLFMAHDAYDNLGRVDRAAAKIRPDCVIANSRFTASTTHLLFPNVSQEICHYPVTAPAALDRASPRRDFRDAVGCVADRVVIACTARMEHWKGQSLLIDALSRLDSKDWEAWIGGGAQRPAEQIYLESLKAQAVSAGIDSRIRFLGQRNDIPQLLAAADIHCQPNLGPEPFGIAFIEAMHASLPILTTRLGAPVELIDASCGQLTEPGDAAALANVLKEWIAQPELRRTLGSGGPPRASLLCNVDRQLQALHDVVNNVIYARG